MPRRRATAGAPLLEPNVSNLRALAHPLRLRMMELFAEQARTTKQVADLLGEPPTRLYHHVAALERAGLLVLKRTQQNRGAVEKYYEGISRQMQAPGGKGRAGKAARRALAMTVLEQARQEMMAAVTTPSAEPALMVRLVVAGTSSTAAAVRQRLQDAVAEIQRDFGCEDSGSGELAEERWALTMAFAPVWPSNPKK